MEKKLKKNENFDFIFLLSNIIETSPEHIPVVWGPANRCLSLPTTALMTGFFIIGVPAAPPMLPEGPGGAENDEKCRKIQSSRPSYGDLDIDSRVPRPQGCARGMS